MNLAGIHPDQGPPLSVPFTFFFTAPLSLMAAGALLLVHGSAVLRSPDAPATLLLTHLGTLGFLTMVMFGAFFQMVPVIASARVPGIRLAHAVHVALTAGLVVFALGALGRMPLALAYRVGFGLIETAVVLFLGMGGVALARTKVRGEVVIGLRIALLALLVAAALGTWMELAYGGTVTVPRRALWIQTHLALALLGWVGGLIGVVAWEVLPMFYLARPVPRWQRRIWLGLTIAGVSLPVGVLAIATTSPHLLGLRWIGAVAAAPAVAAVWVVQPQWLAKGIRARKRRRADASLRYWRVSLALSPVVAVSAALAVILPDPRAAILFVWLAVWGWAGLTVHGMLARIVPFLVWLHRFSRLVGQVPVPSLKALLPDRWVEWVLRAHVATLALGVVAVTTRQDAVCRLLGGAILGTALLVLFALVRVVRLRPPRCYAAQPGSAPEAGPEARR